MIETGDSEFEVRGRKLTQKFRRARFRVAGIFWFVCEGAAILEIEAQGELHYTGGLLPGQVGNYAEG
jgi:hypothetical protein